MSRETAPRFAGIGGHHSAKAGTVEWYTPPSIIAALGPFDLDPCAPIVQPYRTAARVFTSRDDGLIQDWGRDRVWLCPPYSKTVIGKWLGRMAAHDRGTALIFARTETEAFQRYVFEYASAILFMEGRINFHVGEAFTDEKTGRRYEVGDRAPGNAGAPTVLCAYGADDADILAACQIAGKFVPLRIPRSVVVSLFASANEDKTWSDLLAGFFAERSGPVPLDELYRAFADHRKAARNPNFDAKLRQQLQRGPYRRVSRGLWEAAI